MPIFFANDGGLFAQRGYGRACRSTRVKFVIVISYALASSVSGLPSTGRLAAQAAEITFLCVNSSSGTTWNLKVDDERQTADSLPAEFATTRILLLPAFRIFAPCSRLPWPASLLFSICTSNPPRQDGSFVVCAICFTSINLS